MLSEAIKKDIEERFGSQIAYPKDCEALAEDISEKCNKRISSSTLKRLWGFHQSVNEPRMYTMDILANYLRHDNWSSYLLQLEKKGLAAYTSSENIPIIENKSRQNFSKLGVVTFILIVISLTGYLIKNSFKKEIINGNEHPTAFTIQKLDSSFFPEQAPLTKKPEMKKIDKAVKVVETKPSFDTCYIIAENFGRELYTCFKEEITTNNIRDVAMTCKVQNKCLDKESDKCQKYIATLPKAIQDTCRYLFTLSLGKSYLEISKIQLAMQDSIANANQYVPFHKKTNSPQ